jgi:hypothetical protein
MDTGGMIHQDRRHFFDADIAQGKLLSKLTKELYHAALRKVSHRMRKIPDTQTKFHRSGVQLTEFILNEFWMK